MATAASAADEEAQEATVASAADKEAVAELQAGVDCLKEQVHIVKAAEQASFHSMQHCLFGGMAPLFGDRPMSVPKVGSAHAAFGDTLATVWLKLSE